jgi:hypothetical protein
MPKSQAPGRSACRCHDRGVGEWRVVRALVGVVLLGALNIACTDKEPSTIQEEPTPTAGSQPPMVELPHFQGRLPVRLQAGSQVFVDPPCDPGQGRGRICSADLKTTYLTYPDAVEKAHLLDVSMEPTEDRAEWVVTLTFDDARAASEIGRRAVGVGGVLMVVDRDDRVLLAHRPVTVPEHSIRRGRVRLEPTDKPTAWDVVESFVALR